MCILGSYGRQKKDTKIEFEKREREAKQKPFLEDKRKRAEETNRQKQEEKLKKLQEMEMKRQQADLFKEQALLEMSNVQQLFFEMFLIWKQIYQVRSNSSIVKGFLLDLQILCN